MFNMLLKGRLPTELQGLKLRPMDPELDDYTSILTEVCETLEESQTVDFNISGIGESSWKVDIYTDLAVALEQVPALFIWLSDPEERVFNLDFYEQGVERTLKFSARNDDVQICAAPLIDHGPGWRPAVGVEITNRTDLSKMLKILVSSFLLLAESAFPEAINHPWMKSHFAIFIEPAAPADTCSKSPPR